MTFAQAIAELKRKRAAIRSAAAYALDMVGQEAERRIVKVWPVDTGLSRSKWTWKVQKRALKGQLVNDVPYVPFVHKGLAARLVPQTFRDLEPLFKEIFTGRLEAVGRR
jgi:hypothetical protein